MIYPKAIIFNNPLAHAITIAIIHITKAPILKHLLFALYPALIVSDPAMMINRPDQIPPAVALPQNCVAAEIMIIPSRKMTVPMERIAIPVRKENILYTVIL